ncbi:MAG: ABC transporter permease [bacterium]|nr:ABC transporter permease [bacterium]
MEQPISPVHSKVKRFVGSNTILFIYLLMIFIAGIMLPNFRTLQNFLMVARQFSMIAIVVMGQAIVLVSGGFDLSVGAVASLCGMATGFMMADLGWPVWVAIIVGTAIGALCGMFNGFLVAKIGINPLISTLSSSWVFNGIILVTTKGWPVTEIPKPFMFLGQGYIASIPFPIILMIGIGIVLTAVLSRTFYGRYIYAIGGNEISSLFAGINVTKIKISVYMLSGALAGFGGIVLTSRLATAQVGAAEAWTLPSVAAAVIGGVSLSGGEGTIYGALVGAALMGTIGNILVLFHVSSYWQSLVSGFILIIAVTVDTFQTKKHL